MAWGGGQAWGERPAQPAGDVHYSASQIKTYRDCHRKWAFRYLERKPDKPNRFARLGKYIHTQLQRYLETGWLERGPGIALEIGDKTWTHDQIVDIMLPGIVHLPSPGPFNRCEGKFAIPLEGIDATMIGYIDLVYYDADRIEIVTDHKTTSNLRYALSADELLADPQGVIYAKARMVESGAEVVRGRWVYYYTGKRPKSVLTEADFSLAHVEGAWQGILHDVHSMHDLRTQAPAANTVENCLASCDKYGGCPYRPICDQSTGDRLRSLFVMSTLRERMKAAQPVTAPVTVSAPPAQPPAQPPVAPPAQGLNPPEGGSAIERLRALKAQRAAVTAPPAQPPAQPSAQPPAQPPAPVVQGSWPLYIDCAPSCPYVDFSALVQPVLDELRIEYGRHYRLIEGLYGGNGALLAEAVAMHLDANPPAGPVVVTLSSQTARDAIDVLIQRAGLVVRGF